MQSPILRVISFRPWRSKEKREGCEEGCGFIPASLSSSSSERDERKVALFLSFFDDNFGTISFRIIVHDLKVERKVVDVDNLLNFYRIFHSPFEIINFSRNNS